MKRILSVLTLCSVLVLSSAHLAVGQIPPIYPIPPFLEKAIFEKWLELKELSAAPSHLSGYGKVYVLAANGHLYYKDDAGNATDITAGALGGTTTTIEEGDVAVDGSDIVTLDFLAADFIVGEDPDTEVNIAIDYANGQAATTDVHGFLTDTDWDTFNGKQAGHALLTSFAAQTYASGSYSAITGASTVAIRTYAQVLSDIGAAATSHAMSTHSDEDTYSISTSGLATVTKGYVHGAETTQTPSSAFTVDWTAKMVQRVTITGTDLDITFTDPSGPCKLILIVVQGDGADTIDWTNEASILFPGNVDPTLSTGSGDIDALSFYFDGTSYLGLFNGNFE